MRHICQHRRLIEILPQLREPGASGQNPRPARPGTFHVRLHNLQLALVDHWPHIGLAVQSVPHAQLVCLLHARAKKRFIQTAMHITTLHRQAGLPSVHKRSPPR